MNRFLIEQDALYRRVSKSWNAYLREHPKPWCVSPELCQGTEDYLAPDGMPFSAQRDSG